MSAKNFPKSNIKRVILRNHFQNKNRHFNLILKQFNRLKNWIEKFVLVIIIIFYPKGWRSIHLTALKTPNPASIKFFADGVKFISSPNEETIYHTRNDLKVESPFIK